MGLFDGLVSTLTRREPDDLAHGGEVAKIRGKEGLIMKRISSLPNPGQVNANSVAKRTLQAAKLETQAGLMRREAHQRERMLQAALDLYRVRNKYSQKAMAANLEFQKINADQSKAVSEYALDSAQVQANLMGTNQAYLGSAGMRLLESIGL
jgi:hypothetical protein